MSLRPLLALILSFTIATPVAHAGDIDPMVVTTFRKAFLRDLAERVTATIDLNLVHVGFLRDCLVEMTDEQFASAVISKDKNVKFNPWSNCHDGVAQIRQNTRIGYPLLRQRLLLSNLLLSINVQQMLLELAHALYSKRNAAEPRPLVAEASVLSRDYRTSNPLNAMLTSEELPEPQWLPSEVRAATGEDTGNDHSKQDFNNIFQEACANLKARLNGKVYPMNFCQHTRLRSTEMGAIYLTYDGPADQYARTRHEVEMFRTTFQKDQLREFQSTIETEYIAMVQVNPYVALVTSATPKREEFLQAFETMFKRAEGAVADHAKFRAIKRLDDPRFFQEESFLELMQYSPVATRLAESPGVHLATARRAMPTVDYGPSEALAGLQKSHTWQHVRREAVVIGATIAANVLLCWVGRIGFAKALVRIGTAANTAKALETAFSPVCFSISGIAINVGFLMSDIRTYSDIYGEVFASVEEESLIRDVNSLAEQERAIFWSMITVPLGSGIFKYSKDKVAELYSKFSPKLMEKIQKTAPRFANGPQAQAVMAN